MAAALVGSGIWRLVLNEGPSLAYHTGAIIGEKMYIHGGISSKSKSTPSNKLYCTDISHPAWTEIDKSGSPALSHHASVVLEQRYLVLIGGWDGKARVSELHIFDTKDENWIFTRTSGFPVGAGLSSHSATLLDCGDILVIGREGGLRMQRRSGNAFLITGNVRSGHFKYTEHAIGVSSRSGHTVHSMHSVLYTIGGRSDGLLELHGGIKSRNTHSESVSKLCESIREMTPMKKPPCGRKHHISVVDKNCIFIHGGETFDGRSRDPVGEMFLVTVKPHIQFYKLDTTSVSRAGHLCCVSAKKVFIHGGLGAKNAIHSETYELSP